MSFPFDFISTLTNVLFWWFSENANRYWDLTLLHLQKTKTSRIHSMIPEYIDVIMPHGTEDPSFHHWFHLTNIEKSFLAFLLCSVLYFNNLSNLFWYDIVSSNELNRFCFREEKNVWSISGTCFCFVFKEILTKLIGQSRIMLESVVKLLAYKNVLRGFMIMDELNYYYC